MLYRFPLIFSPSWYTKLVGSPRHSRTPTGLSSGRRDRLRNSSGSSSASNSPCRPRAFIWLLLRVSHSVRATTTPIQSRARAITMPSLNSTHTALPPGRATAYSPAPW